MGGSPRVGAVLIVASRALGGARLDVECRLNRVSGTRQASRARVIEPDEGIAIAFPFGLIHEYEASAA